jgi:hypothetical protein
MIVDDPRIFGAIRNLDWDGIYTNADTFQKQAKIVGEYNNFNSDIVKRLADRFGNTTKYKLAREGSVAVYITVLDKNTQISLDGIRELTKADEVDLTGKPGEVRLWWD